MRKRFAEVSNTLTFTPFGAFFYETALFCSFWKPKPCAVLRVKGDGTLQSTCFVAQTIAPHAGQTYLELRFLLIWRPPQIVVVVGEPSSSSEVVVICRSVLRLAAMSAMPGCAAN